MRRPPTSCTSIAPRESSHLCVTHLKTLLMPNRAFTPTLLIHHIDWLFCAARKGLLFVVHAVLFTKR